MITREKFREFIDTASYYEKDEYGAFYFINDYGVLKIDDGFLDGELMRAVRSIGSGKHSRNEKLGERCKEIISGQVDDVSDTGFGLWNDYFMPGRMKIFRVCGAYMLVNESLFYGIEPTMGLTANDMGVVYYDYGCSIQALRVHIEDEDIHKLSRIAEDLEKGKYYE